MQHRYTMIFFFISMVHFLAFGQNPFLDRGVSLTRDSLQPETVMPVVPDTMVRAHDSVLIETRADSSARALPPAQKTLRDVPQNPFLDVPESTDTTTAGGTVSPVQWPAQQRSANPFLAGSGGQTSGAEEEVPSEGIDLLVELTVGTNFPRVILEPAYLSSDGNQRFLFNAGVAAPFAQYFYASLAVRYMQLSFEVISAWESSGSYPDITTKITTQENLAFLSLPIKVGMRFSLPTVTPYCYLAIEPAYLTGGSQLSKMESRVIFEDGSEYYYPPDKPTDTDVTDYRQRHQVLAGGGLGLEVAYGYGSFFIDCGCSVALRDLDDRDNGTGLPIRTGCRLLTFPVTLGIRFYL